MQNREPTFGSFRMQTATAAAVAAASPSSANGGSDVVEARKYNFLGKFRRRVQGWEYHSIYKVPPRVRDLQPEAYEPRVVSIGPYHNGKPHLEPMEEHKHRALRHYLKRAGGIRVEDLVNLFREDTGFLGRLFTSYASSPGAEWVDAYTFPHLMVLDGCFLLELLLTAAGDSCDNSSSPGCYVADDPIFGASEERHAVLPYLRMDLLLVENQIPLAVLCKLATIAEQDIRINDLVRQFFECNYKGVEVEPNEPPGLHVLDVYRRSRLRVGIYSRWTAPMPAKKLNVHGVHILPSSGPGSSATANSLRVVEFHRHKKRNFLGSVYDHFMVPIVKRVPPRWWRIPLVPSLLCAWPFGQWTAEWYVTRVILYVITKVLTLFFLLTLWWYLPLWIATGDLFLPVLVIDESTESLLLNLMAYERLHFSVRLAFSDGKHDLAVTCYVLLMCSLLQSKEDVAYLREKEVLFCVPQKGDETVVALFQRITRGVVTEIRRGVGVENKEILQLCQRGPNKFQAGWKTTSRDVLKMRVEKIILVYGFLVTLGSVVMNIYNTSQRSTKPCAAIKS